MKRTAHDQHGDSGDEPHQQDTNEMTTLQTTSEASEEATEIDRRHAAAAKREKDELARRNAEAARIAEMTARAEAAGFAPPVAARLVRDQLDAECARQRRADAEANQIRRDAEFADRIRESEAREAEKRDAEAVAITNLHASVATFAEAMAQLEALTPSAHRELSAAIANVRKARRSVDFITNFQAALRFAAFL